MKDRQRTKGRLHRGLGGLVKALPCWWGTGHTMPRFCDGQSLASLGRWPISVKRCLNSSAWLSIDEKHLGYSDFYGSPELLMRFALGEVDSSLFEKSSMLRLKRAVIDEIDSEGWKIVRHPDDRSDVQIDYKFLDLLLRGCRHFARGSESDQAPRCPGCQHSTCRKE